MRLKLPGRFSPRGWGASLYILLLCALATGVYAARLNRENPISSWVGWHLLVLIAWTLVLNVSFVSLGHTIVKRLLRIDPLPAVETSVYSMALGLAAFALSMYVAGALHWYHWSFATMLPLLFLGIGARDFPDLWQKFSRGRKRRNDTARRGSLERLWLWLVTGWGIVCVAFLYLQTLTPQSFNFDAIWYHVPIAQDYAREGGLIPFYGDNHRAYPHLTSLLHTWALLVPGVEPMPTRWMLMLHIEFGFVIWRLIGAVAAARWLLGGHSVRGLWTVFFLFPSIFIYDQNIGGSADHVLGATAVPVFLATGRLLKKFDLRYAALAAVALGCHILTKYQAIYLVMAVAVSISLRLGWVYLVLGWKRWRKGEVVGHPFRPLQAAVLVFALTAIVSSPHFIKNYIYYQNPVYPFAAKYFPSTFDDWTPTHRSEPNRPAAKAKFGRAEATVRGDQGVVAADDQRLLKARRAKVGPAPAGGNALKFSFAPRSYDFNPQGETLSGRMIWLHKTLLNWSFETGNRHLTKGRPYMGSLFSLLLPVLFVLRPARRLWFGAGFTYFAFCVWGLTSANDRYLLSFLSIPIALTMALMVRAWRIGWMARLGIVPLVGLQFMWSADAPLYYGERSLRDATKLIQRSYRESEAEKVFSYRKQQRALTQEFPPDAVVLGRYYKDLMGFDRLTLNTHRDIQDYVHFGALQNVRDFWELLRARGVTHLVYPAGKRQPHWARDIVLFDAMVEASENKRKRHGVVLAELPDTPPADTGRLMVLVVGLREYRDGLYAVRRLDVDERRRLRHAKKPSQRFESSRAIKQLKEAGAVLLRGNQLPRDAKRVLDDEFNRVESFGSMTVYIRKSKNTKSKVDVQAKQRRDPTLPRVMRNGDTPGTSQSAAAQHP
jgi:hypothetical protein